jgi:hypothetical protein
VEVHHVGEPAACAASPVAIKVATLFNGGDAFQLFLAGGFTWPATATSRAFGSPYYALCVHPEIPASSPFAGVPDVVRGERRISAPIGSTA